MTPGPDLAASSPTIVFDDVTCRFGDVLAVDRVDVAVPEGRVLAIVGPNGAGKTTLLRLACGLVTPTSGAVTVAGNTPDVRDRHFRQTIGVAPAADRSFYLRLSGLENLLFFARLHGSSKREASRRASRLLEEVGLGDAARRRVSTYSRGMQQRLNLARALLSDPRALVLDETTHDLDVEGAKVIRRLVNERRRDGAAVLWATQRVDELRGFADAVLVLDRGRVTFHGSVPELLERAPTRRFAVQVVRGGVGSVGLDTLRSILGPRGTVVPGIDDRHLLLELAPDVRLGEAISALEAAGLGVVGCFEEEPAVEHAITHLLRNGDPVVAT